MTSLLSSLQFRSDTIAAVKRAVIDLSHRRIKQRVGNNDILSVSVIAVDHRVALLDTKYKAVNLHKIVGSLSGEKGQAENKSGNNAY